MSDATKKEKEMIRKIEWKAQDGRSIVVTIDLVTERSLVADHTMTKACCDIVISATLDGKKIDTGLGNVTQIDHPVAVARIGQLALTQVNYERVTDALSEIKESDYVREWQLKEDAAMAAEREYEKHCAKMRKVMEE
jgi:hypothetical protein